MKRASGLKTKQLRKLYCTCCIDITVPVPECIGNRKDIVGIAMANTKMVTTLRLIFDLQKRGVWIWPDVTWHGLWGWFLPSTRKMLFDLVSMFRIQWFYLLDHFWSFRRLESLLLTLIPNHQSSLPQITTAKPPFYNHRCRNKVALLINPSDRHGYPW